MKSDQDGFVDSFLFLYRIHLCAQSDTSNALAPSSHPIKAGSIIPLL